MATSIPTQTDYDVTGEIQSAFLKVEDVKAGPLAVRIKAVTREHFEARANLPARDAYVLILDGEPEQKLVLNKTNVKTLAAAFGVKTSAWVNRDIDLHLGVTNGREHVRVVIPPPPAPRRARPVAPPAAEPPIEAYEDVASPDDDTFVV